jgi:ferredoxin
MNPASGAAGDEASIRERLRTVIEEGVLPRVRPNRVWAGACREAHSCAACGVTIDVGETEYDLVIAAGVKLFLHPRCMKLWE